MKTKIFKRLAYMALLVGLILSSCSDDSLDPEGNNGIEPEQPEVGEGYFSMAIVNNTTTKAPTDVEDGLPDESNIERALIVLYDDATDEVAYQFELLDMTPTGNDILSVSGNMYITEAKEVARKKYKLAVFLNHTDQIKTATALNTNLSVLQDSVTVASVTGGLTGTSNNEFLMGNFTGLVDVAESDIKDTKTSAESSPVSMNVERAVAKIILSTASNLSTADYTVSDVKWQVDVINKWTYWLRKQTLMLDPTTTTGLSFVEEKDFAALSPYYREWMYAWAPYFRETSAAYWATLTSPGYTQPTPTNIYTYITLGEVTKLPDAIAYVPENTMVANEQWEDVTTSVVITAKIVPTETGLGGTATEDYFIYRNLVFSGTELKSIVDDTFTDDNGNNWAAYVNLNPQLAGLKSLLISGSATLGGSAGDYANVPATSVKYNDISFYKGGVNVYNVPIRHFSETLQPNEMEYGRYGVVRNNVYKLTLNTIDNYGDIDIPTKNNPDDKKSWLSVEFQILPWFIRNQGIGL